jgi:hypothetical protein
MGGLSFLLGAEPLILYFDDQGWFDLAKGMFL